MACLLPGTVKTKTGAYVAAPCGKCPDCRLRRVQAWVFRLLQEDRVHCSSVFATLTYSNEHCPISENGFKTLRKKDYQDFMKRLRFNTGKKTIRYYACGEYGSKTWRPHYHAIIFDANYDEISKAWGLGEIHIGKAEGDSIAYTTKYMCKEKKIPVHSNDDRVPEFSLMSKGMGKNFLTPEMVKYYESTLNSFVTLPGGYVQPLPRYYRDRLFTEAEREAINAAAQSHHSVILEDAIRKAGGINEYYHNRHEAIRSAMRRYSQQKNNKRDTL